MTRGFVAGIVVGLLGAGVIFAVAEGALPRVDLRPPPAPVESAAPAAPVAPRTDEAAPEPTEERESQAAPAVPAPAPVSPPAEAPAPSLDVRPAAPAVVMELPRLPGDGAPAGTVDATQATGADAGARQSSEPAASTSQPALQRNAGTAVAGAGEGLGLVVRDDGRAPDAWPAGVTVVLTAPAPGVAARAAALRQAGVELALVPRLPESGRASEVAVALTEALVAVPEAASVLLPAEARLGRALTRQVAVRLGRTGHALLLASPAQGAAARALVRNDLVTAEVQPVADVAALNAAVAGEAELVLLEPQLLGAALTALEAEGRHAAPVSALLP